MDILYKQIKVPTLVALLLHCCYGFLVCSELPDKQLASDQSLPTNSVNHHREPHADWVIVTKKEKKQKRQRSTGNGAMVNDVSSYRLCAAYQASQITENAMDHIIKRHHDPCGKYNHMIQKDPCELLNKPYKGVINNQYRTFFPQNFTTKMIGDAIKEVLAKPYYVGASKKFDRALELRGKLVDNIATVVIVSKQSETWNVVTAYPKIRNR